jgi:phage terminase large subunit-like protein
MGALVVKAIERQRAEVAEPPEGYAWEAIEADKACALAEELAFPKGPKRGQRFLLEPWEVWFLRCIFGWEDAVTHLPRFHKITAFIPKGNGKALALDTPIPTPSGWTAMGDIRAGDRVFDERGEPCIVVGATDVMRGRPCFEVEFAGGERIVADAEHQWETLARVNRPGSRDRKKVPSVRIRTTREIADTLAFGSHGIRNHTVRVAGALNLPDAELPIPPYVLGAWLGDGDSDCARLTYALSDSEILGHIQAEGVTTDGRRKHSDSTGRSLLGSNGRGQPGSLQSKLRVIGLLGNKHVPAPYLRASAGQRFALLRGLMDTDGCVSAGQGQCEFTSTNEGLARGVLEIAGSLGLRPTIAESRAALYGRDCGPKWRVMFHAYDDTPVFRLERKKARLRKRPISRSLQSRRAIVAVRPIDSVPVRCIEVDSPSHLYLAGRSFIPTHNSPLAAAIGCIVIARGRDIGAKVYSAAVTEKQANNVFQPAQEMLRLSPKVMEAAGLVVGEHAIKGVGDARTFERVSAEKRSADGTVGDCYIVDEVHQHPTRALYDVLANNASKVDGSRIVVISTAGTDPSPTSIGWLLYGEARELLLGKTHAPAHFAVIFEADRDRDPWEEATWRQANPNFGISISARNFRTTAEAARIDPTAQPHFFATRLGWWSRGANKWMDPARWDAAARSPTEDDFTGRAIYLGIDYAPKLDLSAIVQVAVTVGDDGLRRYVVRSHGYIPEGSPTVHNLTVDGEPILRQWAADGWMTLTPGDVLDASYLRPQIMAIHQRHPGAEVCLDPFGCIELMASLPAEGITPIEITQTWKHHSPAMTEVQVALSQGRLVHDGSPVMSLCMSNVVARTDRNGNATPDRDNETKKIDLAVGLLNAMYRAMTAEVNAWASVTEIAWV